jgi:pilus assembly protein FimV
LKHRRLNAGRFALSGLALATACLWGLDAHALGLGRLSVQSALGEPLRAEIDVTSLSAEEAATLQLRVAPPDAYRAAGVEYNPALPGAELQLVRTPDGRAVIKVTSSRAVQEPFVDVILEMTWASGRLVREYTMLLDPPTTRLAAPPPAVPPVMAAAPPAPPAARPQPAPERRAPAPRAEAPAPAPKVADARPPAPPPAAAPASPAAPAPASGDQYRVKPGDTLSRIAGRVRPASVSLDQMLVALFRGNPDAFVGNNMNRLKAGEVLAVPGAEAAQQITQAQAREVIQAQSADFASYRQQLASGVVAPQGEAPARVAKGSVQTEVQDAKQAAAPSADRLTLTQGSVKASAPEAAIAKDAEKKDAATRVAELSRNVEELKQLQAAAQASAPAGTAPAPGAAASAAIVAAAPAVVAASAPEVAASAAVVATAPVAAAAPPAPPAPRPPAAAPEEPGLVDGLLGNPLLLPGAGVLLALVAGFGAYRLRNRLRKGERDTSFLESRLQPDSFFGASGGQRVDTHDAPSAASSSSSLSYSLSQLDAIGDVDPVAEADVYLAYGRDLQAEEILKEAMRANPERLAVRTKLLEVYAKRRDTKGYEQLAGQLFALAGAESEDWQKAQELGRQIDPENPLYAPGGQPDLIVREGGRVVQQLDATTMPQSIAPTAAGGPISEPASLELERGLDLEIDLDLDAPAKRDTAPGVLEATRPFTTGATMADDGARVAERPTAGALSPSKSASALESLDFDLGDLTLDSPTAPAAVPAKPAAEDFASSLPAFDLGDDGDPLARKLELAEEFRQIGDMEGARDLLEEVIAQADGALKVKAQGMLDKLG